MKGKVCLHIDLDCFYAQVEQKRLGIPREVPCAVQQWEGLIAINYAARALGITRHMRVGEALQKCPELQCIHVQTVGGETGQEGTDGAVNGGAVHPANRAMQKASLERYRRASTDVLAVFRRLVPQVTMEKASIDEVYLDVTPLVEKELAEREDAAAAEHAATDAFAWGSIVEGGPLDTESEYDRRLSAGAAIACRLRGAVLQELGFTCSAGIAQNKLLAKVGSARNKPNQQTIVTARGVLELMRTLPLRKLRNFGGKLGAELQAMGAATCGEAAALPLRQLQQRFGPERAAWILDCVRGTHDEPVTERDLPKSMLAAKSFEATSDTASLARWLGVLADELAERLATDAQANRRQPRLLVLSYRQKDTPAGRSRSVAMPRGPAGAMAGLLKEAGLGLLQRSPDSLPCCNLGLTATDFYELPADGSGSITRFLQPRTQQPSGPVSPAKGGGWQQEAAAAPVPKLQRAGAPKTIDNLFRQAACKRGREPDASEQPSSSCAAAAAGQQPASGGGGGGGAEEAQGAERPQPGQASAAQQPGAAVSPPEQPAGAAAAVGSGGSGSAAAAAAQQPGQGSASPPSRRGAAAAQEGAAAEGLEGVDVGEQKRILHEIWVRQTLQQGRRGGAQQPQQQAGGGGRRGGGPAPRAGQPRLTDMFAKRR